MLGKLIREQKVSVVDMNKVLSAGISPEQIEDAAFHINYGQFRNIRL